ncbi:hypothetical protein [Pedobacter alluvionis]|uniref:Uncharacterized protein n=1 Tax=Pedobacter alluvionis TaxID=475253 RepID=A0A497XMN3_9SPHI|nr:hypothetical protein [Pedobacter alluvionis]RLJ69209.1 hypothetical protein BCL90_5307 [Pedobacter alluvionis]TFB29754.1 hypothetical protein E3V97_16310 [Pedobacter alluvionis]
MATIVKKKSDVEFKNIWTLFPDTPPPAITYTKTPKSIPLSSIVSVRYFKLLSKIDYFASKEIGQEDSEYHISGSTFYVTKEILKWLSVKRFIERDVAIHIFSNQDNGIQIELDGQYLKADIEILDSTSIEVRRYTGSDNTVTKHELSVSSLYLLDDFVNQS